VAVESILPLARPESPTQPATVDGTGQGSVQPLLVGATQAARLCGISLASWHRLNAAAKVPKPSRLGGRTLWSLEHLRLFVDWGCPPRREFEARLSAKDRR
jgi:hypothetical protein